MPLKTPALAEAELTYSPQFHQPDVLLCASQDCPYGQCSRTYPHSAEYKPKNSCPCCFLLSRLTEITTSLTYRFGALRQAQGERKLFFQRDPPYPLQTLKSPYLSYSPSVIAEPRPSLLFLNALPQQFSGVLCLLAAEMFDLLAAGNAGSDDFYIRGRRFHRRSKPAVADCER